MKKRIYVLSTRGEKNRLSCCVAFSQKRKNEFCTKSQQSIFSITIAFFYKRQATVEKNSCIVIARLHNKRRSETAVTLYMLPQTYDYIYIHPCTKKIHGTQRETERVVAILSFQSKPQPHNTCYTIWARTTPLQQQSLVPHGIIYFLFHLRFISYNDHTPQKRALVFYIHTVHTTTTHTYSFLYSNNNFMVGHKLLVGRPMRNSKACVFKEECKEN